MAITFHCPHCSASMRVADSAAGKHGECLKCGQRLEVPTVSTSSSQRPVKASPTLPAVPPPLPIPDNSAPIDDPLAAFNFSKDVPFPPLQNSVAKLPRRSFTLSTILGMCILALLAGVAATVVALRSTELARTGVHSGPAETTHKNCVASGGIASFPDGRTKQFTALGAYKSKTYITDDENSASISFSKIEKHMTTDGELIKAHILSEEHREVVTKKEVSLFDLARISFGPVQRIDARLSDGSSYHYYNFCEVEIESLDGLKEKFLDQFPPTMFVKWKGDITTSTLDGDQGEVCGITFQSQK